ncbi:MAG: response regulator [Verrucomicrobia bacterium]|nr:response regulator [Verrucomicrobiota bacterium]
MITERVSPHLGRGQIGPLNAKGPIRRRRKNGSYITRGFIQLLLKPVLRLLQKILLPLQLHHSQPVQVPQLLLFHRRVDPGPKQGGIERFGQIIFRPQFDITEATDGKKALELLGEKSFDVMLLDIEMPEMNGMEVLTAVKANPEWRGDWL